MLKTILTKLDEVSDKLKTLDEHSVALAKLTERVSNIEKSIDGQRAMRRWVGLGPKRRTSQTNAPAPVVASQSPGALGCAPARSPPRCGLAGQCRPAGTAP